MGEAGIREIFLNEAREILTNLESEIVQLEERAGDQETINRVFRYIHTLKGSSGIAGFKAIYDFTHKLENLFDDVRSGTLVVNNKLVDLILNSIDWVKAAIFDSDRDSVKSERLLQTLVKRIADCKGTETVKNTDMTPVVSQQPQEIATTEDGHIQSEYKYFRIRAYFKDDIFETGIDPLAIIEDLLSLGTLIIKGVFKDKLPELDLLNPEKCYLGWDLVIKTSKPVSKLHDVFIFVAEDNHIVIEDITDAFYEKKEGKVYHQEKKIGEILLDKGIISETELEEVVEFQDTQRSKIGNLLVKKGYATENEVDEALREQEELKRKIEHNTIRVDTNRLDNLLNLLGEIVIGQAGLAGIADELDDEMGFRLKNALYGLDRTTREFQEQIMSIRMIPIGPTFEQFRRFVRDSAQVIGKDIKIVIEGGETELDKTVIERISDPLKHMIRNSIDHGIETPEIRFSAGKPKTGTLTLRAYHQEGNIYIEISDDGNGIDLDKVRKKAEKMGFLNKDEDVTRERLLQFLFQPGFSTAEKVGDLSGRGVGMDVVKTNIEGLRGMVEIKTEKGKGTMMRIKLPLTLAIIDGMLVSIGNYTYIIPLLSIVESMQPKKEEVKTIEGKGEVILVRGEYVSLIRMYELFGVEGIHQNPWDGLVVIVESGNDRVGLLIDDLLGQQQIVIKSLDTYITRSRAVSGAAILGDGKVALIIDIHGLIEEIYRTIKGDII